MKRLEELAHESSALKAYLVPQLEALCNIVSEMVNFGIQVSCINHLSLFIIAEIISACPRNDASYRRSTRFQIFFPTWQGVIICQQHRLINGGKDLQGYHIFLGISW